METLNNFFKNSNFIQRVITALILAPIVLSIVYLGGSIYLMFVLIMAVLMAFEWKAMISNSGQNQVMWNLIGVFYIVAPTFSLIWIREQEKGKLIIFWLLAIIWVTDIAAYLAGNLIGGWKIYPKISPNKTWSGLIGGVTGASIIGYLTAVICDSANPEYLIGLSAVLSFYGQVGDFIESWIKRKFGVKDSGQMIPGHGGILDRVDSLVPVAPKIVFILLLDKWGIF